MVALDVLAMAAMVNRFCVVLQVLVVDDWLRQQALAAFKFMDPRLERLLLLFGSLKSPQHRCDADRHRISAPDLHSNRRLPAVDAGVVCQLRLLPCSQRKEVSWQQA